MKALLPSMKERKRYIVFEVVSKTPVGFEGIAKALHNAANGLFGEMGRAKMALKPMGDVFDAGLQRGIVRTNREYVNHARAAFCMVRRIGKSPAIVRSLGVSGTLKKALRKYGGMSNATANAASVNGL